MSLISKFDWESFINALTEGTNVTLTVDDTVFVRKPEFFSELQYRMTQKPAEEFQKFEMKFVQIDV